MKTSKFLRLDWRDFFKALLVAFLAFLVDFIQKSLIPNLQISNEIKVVLISGVAYLAKNWVSPQKEVNVIQSIGLPRPKEPTK